MTKSCAFVTHEGAAPSARQRERERERERERVKGDEGGRSTTVLDTGERTFALSVASAQETRGRVSSRGFHVSRFSGNYTRRYPRHIGFSMSNLIWSLGLLARDPDPLLSPRASSKRGPRLFEIYDTRAYFTVISNPCARDWKGSWLNASLSSRARVAIRDPIKR